jgi:SSS family solute:Na+ symporter
MDFLFSDIPGSRLSGLDLILLILYALACLFIGIWASRRQKDSDFMIAGRGLNTWAFITSVVASYIGGAAIVAYTAYVYRFGISALAVFIGTSAGFLIFIPYAMKLRRVGEKQGFITLSDWFFHNFGKRAGLVSSLILFVVYFGMLLNQFIAGSSILSSISGWSYETALFLSSIIISIYLFAGGFRSVVKTDIFQYIVLFVLFIILGFILLGEKREFAVELVDFQRMDMGMTIAFIAFGIFIIFQSAEYWQRVYAAKSDRVVKRGFTGAAILTIITGIAITLIGLASHYYLDDLDARNAFAEGLNLLIPETYLGAALVLIFAAIMSSADTQIFVLSSSVSVDWMEKFSKHKLNPHQVMRRTRWLIIGFSALGFVFAYFLRDLVAVIVFITGVGFTIIPATIASFHMKLSQRAATGSFLAGTGYVVGLVILASLQPEPFEFFKNNAELAILSVVVSALTLFLIYFADKRKPGQ